VHSRLVEGLRADNPLIQHGHMLAQHFSLTAPSGVAALNAEVTRQAVMVGYIDDFKLMMMVLLCSLPLVLLIKGPKRAAAPGPAPPQTASEAAAGED
jgi:DHA2 family multidrug resistance protein